jgi:hypothetical protein
MESAAVGPYLPNTIQLKIGVAILMRYSVAPMLTACLLGVLAIATVGVVDAEICKWVDEDGCVHYTETCPEGVEGTEVEIQPSPSREQVEEAVRRSAKISETRRVNEQSEDSKSEIRPHAGRSLPLEELGPLPENSTSTYLTTLGADYSFDTSALKGQFWLKLQARENLPRGAYLEAHFPNPANAEQKHIVGKELHREGGVVRMLSPKATGFECWNYEIEVFVYEDDSKDKLLDTHRQVLQSRIDLSLVNSAEELLMGMAGGGRCPSAHQRDMKKMSIEQLEALCERERENHLKPEREKLIERCIKTGKKQPESCENYYSDWGDAQRLDRYTMRPALYYHLPECIAAKEAREKNR